jgi:hypothetical protein
MHCPAKMDPHRTRSRNRKILVRCREITINVILSTFRKMIPIVTVIYFRTAAYM